MPRASSLVRTAALLVSLMVGAAAGVGGYTFVYARGGSYLSDDPRACVNCHVMREQYDGWVKSSHHAVATCNDCHMPHGIVSKIATKTSNGFWHSLAFTTGDFPDPIRIKRRNWEVAESSCRTCHAPIVLQMDGGHPQDERLSCISCHDSVGHPSLAVPPRGPMR